MVDFRGVHQFLILQVHLVSFHDEFSLWFNLVDELPESDSSPVCECGLHVAFARTRYVSLLVDRS